MHPNVHSSTIYNSQVLEAPKCPSANEWVKKLWDIYTMEYYAAEKKEGAYTLCNSMDGTGEHMLSEISQAVRDKYHMISPISGT